MKNTNEEIEINNKLVRESKKRETALKFEELFEKWKGM